MTTNPCLSQSRLCLLLLTGFVFLLAACSSSDDEDPTDPGGGGDGDTTSPFVTSIDPQDGALLYDSQQGFQVFFSEAMDPDSAEGNITLSAGSIMEMVWSDPSSLMISPNPLPEASEITLTIGTGLTDEAGNSLASSFTATYTTLASQLALEDFSPAGGSTDINRNTTIILDFTEPVTDLESGVTISDGNRTDYSFTVTGDDMGRHSLDPDLDFPADTEITVTITTQVYGDYTGTSLLDDVSFSFTTGTEIDNTPPSIVGITPASGSVLPVDQGTITVEFDEPVDLTDFSPPSMNGQFAWALYESGLEPELNVDGTELTVYLPAILPEGLSLEVVLAGYADSYGNAQTAETQWSATVAGTASPLYLEDGHRYTASGTAEEGDLGNSTPTDTWDEHRFYEIGQRVAANQWELREYEWQFSALDYYEILSATSERMSLLGFAEDEGSGFQEFFASSPLLLLELPFSAGNTWTSSASVTVPDGTMNVSLDGEVVAQQDLEVGYVDGTLVTWTGTWKVLRDVTISADSEVVAMDSAQQWIVPGIGIVREIYHEENLDPEDSGWFHHDVWRDLDSGQR